MVRITGNKLFAFTEAKLEAIIATMSSVRDEAVFLFTRLTILRISSFIYKTEKVINIFQEIAKLEFIAIDFPFWNCALMNDVNKRLLLHLNGLKLNETQLNGIDSLDMFFTSRCRYDANDRLVHGTSAWTGVTNLFFNDYKIGNMDVSRLADLFPQLENLHIRPKPCLQRQLILTNDPFTAMNNMRVLKLDKVAFHLLEILDGGCMPHLEELYVSFADELDSLTRVESFPALPKLTLLTLHLERVTWIQPNAFDHLTQLVQFEIHCKQLEDHTFETGVAARSMSFHLACSVLKLTSSSVSNVEHIEMINYNNRTTARLETCVPLSRLQRLITRNWTNEDLPFHQMTNLEYVSLETSDLSILSRGQLVCLTKLRVLEVKKCENEFSNDFSISYC
jgi:hypothetical protein